MITNKVFYPILLVLVNIFVLTHQKFHTHYIKSSRNNNTYNISTASYNHSQVFNSSQYFNHTSPQQNQTNSTFFIDNYNPFLKTHQLLLREKGCITFNKDSHEHFQNLININKEMKHAIKTYITSALYNNCDEYNPKRHINIFRDWRYGNWCGVDYGGFDGPCKQKCLQDKWTPTEDCVKCCEPMDYLDQQCMYHDFCQERFEKYKIGSDICKHSATIGGEFPTPCNCSIHLADSLQFSNLVENCDSSKCVLEGMALKDAVSNLIMPCGCTYKQCNLTGCYNEQICTSQGTCKEFGGW